eukprot:349824-Chlamydomonas_euryale.AAC.21
MPCVLRPPIQPLREEASGDSARDSFVSAVQGAGAPGDGGGRGRARLSCKGSIDAYVHTTSADFLSPLFPSHPPSGPLLFCMPHVTPLLRKGRAEVTQAAPAAPLFSFRQVKILPICISLLRQRLRGRHLMYRQRFGSALVITASSGPLLAPATGGIRPKARENAVGANALRAREALPEVVLP